MRRVSKRLGAVVGVLMSASFLPMVAPANAVVAPVGQGFTVTPSDLAFILKQIKISEAHVANTTSATGPCGALVGTGPNQIPSPLVSRGLRTVDGSCNNLQPGQETFGAADQTFPRLGSKAFLPAEGGPVGFFGPAPAPPAPASSDYAQTSGNVFDTQPRVISNLIVDQTSTNPAAVAAAGFPARTQGGGKPVVACVTDPVPATTTTVAIVADPPGCVPSGQTLFIPNVTTDVGLSPPYNSMFTLFGQFFDHGIDQTVKGGSGTVFVPLQADDPLIAGPDRDFTTVNDNLPASKRFMVLTRATNQPGLDGVLGTTDDVRDAKNTDSPWVDQSQTYTSHPSHQVFLREYVNNAAILPALTGKPVSTGKLLGGPAGPTAGGMATWATVKTQAESLLGLKLVDRDVTNVPMMAVDPYGKFIPGANGLPQYVTKYRGMVEGNLTNPVPVPTRRAVSDGVTTVDSSIVTSDTAAFTQDDVGSVISGAGIAALTRIVSVDSLTQVTVSSNATVTNTAVALKVDPGTMFIDTPFLTDIAHNADPSPQDTDHNPATPPVPPVADADTTASANFAAQPAGTYDDEMLNAHFIAGDGRVNENIGLTAIHQVFHSEHDRLVGDIQNTLTNDTSPSGAAALAEWKSAAGAGGWNGERLFQAARFVTEMEYQHLVFEEFARKIQPAINPFQPFAFTQTEINPAVSAEFAHAVYRFGHSMLTETISRKNENGTPNDISLLAGFLNPPEYTNGGSAGPLSSEEAAGSVIMGMSDQVGGELDEFVTDTLRNKLLGLPLDLATINMARARSEGIPRLNVLRKDLFASTNDAQLKPYTNWIDFGENIKHPQSLVNFVAAYGQHPTILTDAGPDGKLVDDLATAIDETADNGPATLASRRVAARAIVNPIASPTGNDVPPSDAAAFMNSIGAWANVGTRSVTGLDDVDLWVGGLAERTNLFGGLLGSTFNYVFESQMTKLQNGDRLYYLARTPGMNLRTQLEGNSFAELMMRNTNAKSLKADSFATADCKFELKNLAGTALGFSSGGNIVADDTTTECSEAALLIRMPDGTIKYRASNTVDPAGINGQAVYNGTPGVDRIHGGVDNDTFWGGLSDDVIEGGDGADVALGGEGNDIITDRAGDDVLKGGPGNDAINAGPGLDIMMGGEGNDFTNGGANANTTFGGAGNDFMILGEGIDGGLGDSGDDWIEGGDQPDGLIGDSSNLFFLDDNTPGNDILIGQGGDDDYDMEGGDDIGVAGPGIEKNAGAAGFDWSIGLQDPQPMDSDLALPIAPLDILTAGVRDKFNEVEALSGGNLNDTLRGDSVVPSTVGGGGFIGCDVLDQTGVDRIRGLGALMPVLTGDSVAIGAASAIGSCPLTGPIWGDGNILLGGGGSDLIEGRGADDIIDGDKYLNVRLSVRTSATDQTEIGSATGMTTQYQRDSLGALTGPTLQEAVFAGTIDPGNIVAVREILAPPAVAPVVDVDTALFSGPRSNYTTTYTAEVPASLTSPAEPAKVTVTQTGANVLGQKISDGIDTLRGIEVIRFSDQSVSVQAPAVPDAPTIGIATAGDGQATVNWTAAVNNGLSPILRFDVQVLNGGGLVTTLPAAATASSLVVPGLTNGITYRFVVTAVNAIGSSAPSATSNDVTPVAVVVVGTPPGAPIIRNAAPGVLADATVTATANWRIPRVAGSSPITTYEVTANATAPGGGTTSTVSVSAAPGRDQTLTMTLAPGTYRFTVVAISAVGPGLPSGLSNLVTAR